MKIRAKPIRSVPAGVRVPAASVWTLMPQPSIGSTPPVSAKRKAPRRGDYDPSMKGRSSPTKRSVLLMLRNTTRIASRGKPDSSVKV